MNRAHLSWPEADTIVTEYLAGAPVYGVACRHGRDAHQVADLLSDRGVLRAFPVRVSEPKPTRPAMRLLAAGMLMVRQAAQRSATPEEIAGLIEAIRKSSGGKVCPGTGVYTREARALT